MINKIKYYFKTGTFTSKTKESIEEIKQDVRNYKKQSKEEDYIYIYKIENSIIFDKNGIVIYSSNINMREFNAEEEVN